GIEDRCLAALAVVAAVERARPDGTPPVIGVVEPGACARLAKAAVLEALEGRLGPRAVLRLHPPLEGVVELERAAPRLAQALERGLLVLRDRDLAPRDGARQIGRL